ncbi:MAG: hypothetical protein PVF27_01920 [Gemmatimonadales bacterium]|jgi:hypothetical protein
MIQIQVVPRAGVDAYKLLRAKVLHEAATWEWSNKAKTRLRHIRRKGHIDVANAGGVVTARIVPKERGDLFYLGEKFMGRMVAWFEDDLAAINMQFVEASKPTKTRKARRSKPKRKKKAVKRR